MPRKKPVPLPGSERRAARAARSSATFAAFGQAPITQPRDVLQIAYTFFGHGLPVETPIRFVAGPFVSVFDVAEAIAFAENRENHGRSIVVTLTGGPPEYTVLFDNGTEQDRSGAGFQVVPDLAGHVRKLRHEDE